MVMISFCFFSLSFGVSFLPFILYFFFSYLGSNGVFVFCFKNVSVKTENKKVVVLDVYNGWLYVYKSFNE